jgi:predicted nuclease of predicted toxin-antitoxin system
VRFLIDMPATPLLAQRLGEMGHDAIHAVDAGLATATDSEIIARAQAEGRVIVTCDLDYPRLLALSAADGPGVVLFRGGSYSDRQMLDLMERVLRFADELDLSHSIVVVDQERIRRHRLPVAR